MTETAQQAKSDNAIKFERTDNFTDMYANSVIFQATAWDLKLVFGQLDMTPSLNVVKQHLAVTIPWPQAKSAIFWLRLHVAAAEAEVDAKIPIRQDLLPPELPQLTPEQENDPKITKFYLLYRKLREEFIATL